jgi:hypothetical protein
MPTLSRTASYQNTIPFRSVIGGRTYEIPILFDTGTDDYVFNIMNTVLGQTNLNSFLNQSVQVRPTTTEINSATELYTASRQSDDNCAICQDRMESGQQIRRIYYCNHSFHKDCIDTWFGTNVRCPTCRHDIRELVAPESAPPPVPSNHRRTNIRDSTGSN